MATQKDSKMVVVGEEEKKEHKTKGHPSPPPPSPPPPQRNLIASTTSPPTSSSSSPSHEFSFTISLHPSIDDPNQYNTTTKSPPPFTAIDLAPADDIFFHGHLLPLRILSHQVLIPPTTTTSSSSTVSFDPPIEEPKPPTTTTTTTTNDTKPKKPNKPIRNLSNLFGAEFSRVVKKYVSASLLFLRGSSTREKAEAVRRRPCTFSGKDSDLVLKERRERWKGRRGGQFSAPASMRTSPTNSGLLMATAGGATFSSSDESTMEELNNAIQAAVAHCKNSIAMKEEKCKC